MAISPKIWVFCNLECYPDSPKQIWGLFVVTQMSFAFGHSAAQTQTHIPIFSAEFLCGTHGLSLQLDALTLCFSEAGSHCSSWAHAGLEFILLSRSTSRVLGLWACAATSQLSVVYSDFFFFSFVFVFFFFSHYPITPTSVLFVSFFWQLPLFSWVFAWTVLF